MPKLTPARLSGLYGMQSFTAEELHQKADWYESQIKNPESEDDPRYLLRWAKRVRKLAMQKEKSIEQKNNAKK